MANHTQARTRIQSPQGGMAMSDVQVTSTDAPLLPIDSIERLHAIAPERLDWVFTQTEREAEHRRSNDRRLFRQVFIERLLGISIAASLSAGALYIAYMLAMAGHHWPAIAVATTTAIGLATAFLLHRQK